MSRLVAAEWLAIGIVVLGCSEHSKSATAPPPQVTFYIAISSPDSTLVVGEKSQLTAALTRSDGQATFGVPISWSSSDTSIATVNGSGLLSAKAAGSVEVSVSAEGASAKTGIRVRSSPRDGAAKMAAESVYVGQTIDLRAYLLDNGTPAFTDSTTWSSSDPAVGTVDGGVFTPLARGVSTVTATRGTKVGVVDVLAQTRVKALTLAPDTLDIPYSGSGAFAVLATDSAGKPIFGRPITWSLSEASRFEIDSGVLKSKYGASPIAGGTTTVTAVSEGAVAMAVVRLTAPSGYLPYLTAPQTWVNVGKTLQVNSAAHDPGNFYLPNASLTWSSSDSSIARVSTTGVVTGVARGKAVISADARGHKGTFVVNVEQALASVGFLPDTVYLALHGSLPLSASLRDADGNTLTPRPISWATADTSLIQLAPDPNNVSGFVANARGTAGNAAITGSIGDIAGTLNVVVTSSTDQMEFDYPYGGAASYSTYDAHVYGHDGNGLVFSGRGVRIVSSDPGILRVQPDTAAFVSGVVLLHVTAGRAGNATLTATSGSVSTTYLVAVAPGAVTLSIAFKPAELPVGKTYRLTTNVTQHVVDWSTSDPSIATVSDSGVITPLAGGVVRIVARARDAVGAAADSATIVIRAQQAPVVSAISATELQPGASVTITGQNFGTTPGANVVTIDGVPAQVTAATATQLDITVPGATSFPCQATHLAQLVLSTGPGLITSSQQMLASAPQRSLDVGDADLWSQADSRCNELAKGHGFYLLTISNGGTSAAETTGFSFMVDTGSFASSTVAATAARIPLFSRSLASPASLPGAGSPPGVLRINMDSLRRAAMAHRNLLERSRKLASRLGSPLAALQRAARLRASRDVIAAAPAVPDTGTKMFVRVPQLDTPDFCGDYRTIQARVVYTGTHSIILEDVQAPLAGQMDSYYQSVGAEFDRTTYDVIASNFGDPMAMDQSLGGPGRVTMLFTPAVNEMGPTGFVVGCDFYPQSIAPSSNEREMFYAVVPTSSGTGFNGEFTRDVWRHIIRGTIAHETKHIASFAEHYARQAPQQEESWLEEGTAMIAMELWARTVTSTTWKGGNGYNSALYCDVRPTVCGGQPYTMFDHFAYLHDFLTPSERHTPLGATNASDASFYGSVWWLVRWAIDQYATDEGAFLRALTQEATLTGVSNLSARTGRAWSDLIRDWSLATLTSYEVPTFTPHDARLTTPSWRLRDVFDGMSNDFPSEFGGGGIFTFHVQQCTAAPTVIHDMPPGSVSFYYLDTCQGWKNFLRFQSDAAGSPSPSLSIGVLRIQ